MFARNLGKSSINIFACITIARQTITFKKFKQEGNNPLIVINTGFFEEDIGQEITTVFRIMVDNYSTVIVNIQKTQNGSRMHYQAYNETRIIVKIFPIRNCLNVLRDLVIFIAVGFFDFLPKYFSLSL